MMNGRIHMPTADDYRQVVVFADAQPALAHLVRNRLAEVGIKAFIDNDATWQAAGDLPGSAIAPPRVVVAQADAERARKIVAEFTAEANDA